MRGKTHAPLSTATTPSCYFRRPDALALSSHFLFGATPKPIGDSQPLSFRQRSYLHIWIAGFGENTGKKILSANRLLFNRTIVNAPGTGQGGSGQATKTAFQQDCNDVRSKRTVRYIERQNEARTQFESFFSAACFGRFACMQILLDPCHHLMAFGNGPRRLQIR